MTKSNPEFRKIPSLYYLYEVSEDGRIFRNVKSKKQSKIILDTHHSNSGYYATFVNIKGKARRVMLHKVVAECWLGERPDGLEIDHIDRNTHNNHYTNLRYVTHSEQMKNRVLSDRIIEQAKKNCLEWTMANVAKQTTVIENGESVSFPSMTQAAKYIAEKKNVKTEHVRGKMKQRRSHILGFDIQYGM